jgi:hypothetical protein
VTATSDIPAELEFVDPAETDLTFRVVLWAAPGQGKSVAAASAPAPILVVNADRPSAYRFARKHHGHTAENLREVRYQGPDTLAHVYKYLNDHREVKTVIVDPVSNVIDQLADVAPPNREKDGPDYSWVNKKFFGFVKSLRVFDVNVVLVGHEKLNDSGKRKDGMLYPAIGGMTLINKLLGEMDIVARVERLSKPTEDDPDAAVWVGQIQPRDNLVTKDGTGALGDRRIADLGRWFEIATEALSPSDVPWSKDFDPEESARIDAETAAAENEQTTLEEAGSTA